ncbi:hypothetical protein SAMN05216582_10550 [Selenomonas ruminantium]|uniref:Uncharacterized protein n=1 Tax=Selenomonas ruminantium TaxID=971 RepID=A0A1M6SSW4_SELRU|nr:hypothetical protein [Selenomonas ruminantium]SHK47720.1 hypothetical protein SAMN05216582_10550 [Selenomonas ruminantium]
MQADWKNLPLGLPMTLASVGTLATLFAGKNLHAGFGVAWAALSFWHGWQHHKKMQADARKLTDCCRTKEAETVEPLQALLDSFQVDAYVPGRVRLRSTLLAAYPEWAQDLEAYIRSFTGVETAVINTLTGSLLITYDAAKLRQKPKLAELEQQIAKLASAK